MTLTNPPADSWTIDRLLASLEAFASTLSRSQREALYLDSSRKLAARWSNLPEAVLGVRGRVGLSTGALTAGSWAALWDLLAATCGSGSGVGVDALAQHLAADDMLAQRDPHMGYGRQCFTIAVLGRPDPSGSFTVQFGGHHLAVLNSYDEGRLVSGTPAFRGIEPFLTSTADSPTLQPLRAKHEALRNLLCALDRDQQDQARLHPAPRDLLLGPGRDQRLPENLSDGVSGAELDEAGRGRLSAAIASFTDDLEDDAAKRILEGYRRELAETRISFGGTPSLDMTGDYVRIEGPRLWIELSMRPGINFGGPHPHAVWRDKEADYAGLQ